MHVVTKSFVISGTFNIATLCAAGPCPNWLAEKILFLMLPGLFFARLIIRPRLDDLTYIFLSLLVNIVIEALLIFAFLKLRARYNAHLSRK